MNPAAFASPPADACDLGPPGTGANDFGPDRITRNVWDAAGQRLQLRNGVGTGWERAEASWAAMITRRFLCVAAVGLFILGCRTDMSNVNDLRVCPEHDRDDTIKQLQIEVSRPTMLSELEDNVRIRGGAVEEAKHDAEARHCSNVEQPYRAEFIHLGQNPERNLARSYLVFSRRDGQVYYIESRHSFRTP